MAQTPPSVAPDSFGARGSLAVGDATYQIYRINALADRFDVPRLPYSIKVVLENLLRHEDGLAVRPADIEAVAGWGNRPERHGFGSEDAAEIALTPERVLMQDFTGVPGVVDLAAMRDALETLGGDPAKVNPLVPVELVIDHSVIAESSGRPQSYDENVDIEYHRNIERYQLLRWAQQAFDGFRVVPPGTGICHQVNLEYLSRVVFATDDGQAYCDTLVGTDSHTTMVNGLGVLGWGVGGIEAEAAMLGQPLSLLLPPVVGFRLTGEQPAGTTATDLVLTITAPAAPTRRGGEVRRVLRARRGGGAPGQPRHHRQHVARVRCHLRHLPRRRGDTRLPAVHRPGRQARRPGGGLRQGAGHVPRGRWRGARLLRDHRTGPVHGCAEHRRAGPAPGPRHTGRGRCFVPLVPRSGAPFGAGHRGRWVDGDGGGRGGRGGRHHQLHQHLQPPGDGGGGPRGQARRGAGPRPQALGQDHPGPGITGCHGLPGPGRADRATGRDRVRPGRVRVHHVHREFGSPPRRGVRGRPRARPLGRLRAVGEPQLRGTHSSRRPA